MKMVLLVGMFEFVIGGAFWWSRCNCGRLRECDAVSAGSLADLCKLLVQFIDCVMYLNSGWI